MSVVLVGLVTVPASALPSHVVAPAVAAFAANVPLGSVLSSRLAHLAQKAEPGAALPSAQGHVAGTLPISAASDGEGSVTRTNDGRLLVDVRLDPTASAATLDAIRGAGAEVVTQSGGRSSVTVAVADDHLVELAGVAGVRSAREIITPTVGGAASALAGALPSAIPAGYPNAITSCPTGLVSEGDAQLRAAEARQTFGVDGAGVKIGVLSDSYNMSPTATKKAPADVAAGELPGTGNPCATTPVDVQAEFDPAIAYLPTDEGRAMLQIVHDLAPGSPLAFASVFKGEADMANQIRTMSARGAKVIVDDVSYATEPLYQDGVISAAINDVTKSGTTYLSAAGNSNLVIGGKDVTSYEAQDGYRPTACPTGLRLEDFGAADCHDFDPGSGTSPHDAITLPPNTVLQVELGWNQPINGVTSDFDIFLVDEANPTNITGDNTDSKVSGMPTEWFRYQNTSGVTQTLDLFVTRKAGSTATPRFKFIIQRPSAPTAVQWDTSQGTDVIGPSIYGHNATLAGGTVGAVRYNDSNLVEEFSSRGPATYCWAPVDGTTNAAPPLPGGCQDKPIDVTASNGVQTSFFAYLEGGAWRFYGTSSSTPHVAAIAALARQRDPCRTPAEVLAALRAGAHPVDGAGPGAVGSGLVDAVATMDALAPCGPTLLLPERISAVEGQLVTIDWSASAGTRYTSTFTQKSGPAPTALRETAPAVRKLVAPRTERSDTPTELTYTVTITDPVTGTSATDDVVVSVSNAPPVARIGAPVTVESGSPVLLAGTSTDGGEPDRAPADGVGRDYRWRQIDGPATVTPNLGRGPGFRDASVAPTVAGTYHYGLTVIDHGGLGTASSEAVLTVDVRARAAAGTLSGLVRDETGAPLAQAIVLVFTPGAAGWQSWGATTGADGRWTLSGLPDRAQFLILGGKLGYALRATRNHVDLVGLPTVQSPSATVDLTLPSVLKTHSITGSVRTSTGAPAANVPVELHSPDGQVGHATTDAVGAYRFDWLADGERYRVRVPPGVSPYDPAWVTNDGLGSASWVVQPSMFVTLAGANVAVPSLTVYQPAERRTLAVTVVSPTGVAVAGAELRLFGSDSDKTPIAIVRTDAAGRATISGLRPGPYAVWADPGAGGPAPQWYAGVVGGALDGSVQLSDHLDLRTADATITFALR